MKILRYPMVHDTNYDLAYRRCPRRSMDVRRLQANNYKIAGGLKE
jgi:hypothetical protein